MPMPCSARRLLLFSTLAAVLIAPAATRPQSAAPAPGDGWPRSQKTAQGTLTVFQPQLDSWDGRDVEFHCAASIQPVDEKVPPNFGVLEFTGKTLVDKLTRLVELQDLRATKATLPPTPEQEKALQAAFQALLPVKRPLVALERLEAQLAILGAEKKGQAQPVLNAPPRIIFAEMKTIAMNRMMPVVVPASSWRRQGCSS